MKKEIIIAICIGLGLGLIITYGFYRVQKSVKQQITPQTDLEEVATTSPTIDPTPEDIITILSPERGVIQTESKTVVTGTTLPNTFVILFVNETEFVTTSDADGNFSFEATLETGSNVLIVHVVAESGETFTAERVIIVTDVFEAAETPSTATNSAEPDTAE